MGAASARSRISLGRLRAFGLGEQALKAALAAGLAWALGGLVPGAPPQPYLAPLTAVLTLQLTIADPVAGAVQRTIGVSIGVVVALLAGNGATAAARANFASCREQLTRRAQAKMPLLLSGGWEQLGSMLATL